MATTPTPVLNVVTRYYRVYTGLTGSVITDTGEAGQLQAFLSGSLAPSSFDLTLFRDGIAAATIPSFFSSNLTTYSLTLGLGSHTVTAVATLPGSTASGVSAPLNIYALPAPVAGAIVTGSTSLDYARLFDANYQIGFLNDAQAIQLVDGVIGVGRSSTEAGLQRLYIGLLGRGGDATGIGFYDVQRAGGVSLAGVAAQILASAEYAAKHGQQGDADFVASLYRGFLGRASDSAGAASYLALLASGASRAEIAAAFASSLEAMGAQDAATQHVLARDGTGTLINQVYQAGLNRTVDAGGLAASKALLSHGGTPANLVAGIAGSDEFAALHGGQSDTAYVTSLYQAALGRAPDATGLQGYLGSLSAGGTSRADLLLAIGTSPEATARLPTSF